MRPDAGLRPLGLEDGLDILALMGVAELAPTIPGGRRALQGVHEIGRRLDLALRRVQLDFDRQRLAALETGRFAMAAAQRDADRTAHRCDRAPVRMVVDR